MTQTLLVDIFYDWIRQICTGDNILYMVNVASKSTLLPSNFVEFLINY